MASELGTTWEKAKLAFFKLAILFAFILLHWALAALIHQVLHDQWPRVENVLFVLFLLAFTVIYTDQLWETVGIFVPRLERWRRKVVGGKIRRGEEGHGDT